MSNPKEKAESLMYKLEYLAGNGNDYDVDKDTALIMVDEIMSYLTTSLDVQTSLSAVNYWQEVKEEIEKL